MKRNDAEQIGKLIQQFLRQEIPNSPDEETVESVSSSGEFGISAERTKTVGCLASSLRTGGGLYQQSLYS